MRSEAIRFLAEPVTRMACFSGRVRTSRQVLAAIAVDQTIAADRASATASLDPSHETKSAGTLSIPGVVLPDPTRLIGAR